MHQNISILIYDFKKLFLDLWLKHRLNFNRDMRNKICKLSGINKVIQCALTQPRQLLSSIILQHNLQLKWIVLGWQLTINNEPFCCIQIRHWHWLWELFDT